ncbi:MAG: hypothetical protein ACPHV3_09975 [Vibrio sp.]
MKPFNLAIMSLLLLNIAHSQATDYDKVVYVYEQAIDGVYSDFWYAQMLSENKYKLIREGKSGDLDAPIKLDCDKKRFSVVGYGLLYGHTPLYPEEVENYISPEVVDTYFDKFCPKLFIEIPMD